MTTLRSELRILAVDDEAPSLADLVFELKALAAVVEVIEARDAGEALRALRTHHIDAVFLDVRMPGLDGLELARVLAQFKQPPPVVFVTAFDEHAVEAFDISAVDYLLKPVRRERLEQSVERILARISAMMSQAPARLGPDGEMRPGPDGDHGRDAAPAQHEAATSDVVGPGHNAQSDAHSDAHSDALSPPVGAAHVLDAELISIETGGRVRFVARSDVLYVASSGDYVRLHLAQSSVLVRSAMSSLEEHWARAGFVRIHRSYLVALAHVEEVRVEPGRGYSVRIADRSLPVSRRLAGNLRTRLAEEAVRRSRR